MMAAPNIRSFTRVIPMIYAYTHPDFPPHRGWTKIGYTERQTVEDRIKQQSHTADVRCEREAPGQWRRGKPSTGTKRRTSRPKT